MNYFHRIGSAPTQGFFYRIAKPVMRQQLSLLSLKSKSPFSKHYKALQGIIKSRKRGGDGLSFTELFYCIITVDPFPFHIDPLSLHLSFQFSHFGSKVWVKSGADKGKPAKTFKKTCPLISLPLLLCFPLFSQSLI